MKKILSLLLILMTASTLAFEGVREVTLNDGRTILAADSGLTLYTFDVDSPGQSNCFGGCLTVWPAMTVSTDALVEAPFATHERPDGSLQLMLNDQPLYFFISDQAEGDILGDGLQGVWHIIEL